MKYLSVRAYNSYFAIVNAFLQWPFNFFFLSLQMVLGGTKQFHSYFATLFGLSFSSAAEYGLSKLPNTFIRLEEVKRTFIVLCHRQRSKLLFSTSSGGSLYCLNVCMQANFLFSTRSVLYMGWALRIMNSVYVTVIF